jgi:hypothetical protein
MSDYSHELVADVSEPAVPPLIANEPEIRAHADDAIFGPMPVNKADEGSARSASLLFRRLLGYGLHAALVACLAGFLWLAGLYFSSDQPSHFVRKLLSLWALAPQESAEHAETSRTVQKMAEEIRALKADELAGKVEQLERESAAKLSQIYERFDRIEHPIAPPTTASPAAAPESGANVAKNRARGKRHDAFDPSQNLNAPGAPRPLGSLAD